MTSYTQPPQGQPQRLAAPKNGLGTTALVLGIVGLLFSFIPIIGVVAWPLVILGLIFGIIGFVRARAGKATNGGMAIAGTVLSLIGLLVCILYVSAFSSAVDDLPAAPAAGQPGQAPAAAPGASSSGGDVVVYEVTGSGEAASVTYIKDRNGGTEQQSNTDLPFRREIKLDGGAFSFQVLSLTATNGPSGGDITCRISKNGVEVTTSTSSGPFASATCSGS